MNEDVKNVLVYLVTGGGLIAIGREAHQWWQRRKQATFAAPEHRAVAESRMVATAEQVVELVEERMRAQATEISELRTEVAELRAQVEALESQARQHNLPIPNRRGRQT